MSLSSRIDIAALLHSMADDPSAMPRRCIVIGEVAQAHDGSLGMAHSFIDAIAESGADAVKFQTHLADAESTPHEPWRVRFSPQDETRFDYWKRMEFTEPQWLGLRQHAHDRGLLFLSSPFSIQAVELLSRIGVDAWKVASGEVTSPQMLEAMAVTKLPVLLSTGMSTFSEIDTAVNLVRQDSFRSAVLQCTSTYPSTPDLVGLNVLDEYRRRYRCAVGLSDHSGTVYPGLAAATLGAAVIEVHVAFSRQMFGPDVKVSLLPSELRRLVEGVRWIEQMLANPVDKDVVASQLESVRSIFTKSVVAARDISAGTVLGAEHLATKKPGSGIPACRVPELVGRRLRRDVSRNELLRENDLE